MRSSQVGCGYPVPHLYCHDCVGMCLGVCGCVSAGLVCAGVGVYVCVRVCYIFLFYCVSLKNGA